MKNFKQIINEISLGPKAGKEWSDYIDSTFGKNDYARNFKQDDPHVSWIKSKLPHVYWTYGVPHETGVAMQKLPVTQIKNDKGNIQVHVDSGKYEDDLKRFKLSHAESMNIPNFVDQVEDPDYGTAHQELQAQLTRNLGLSVRVNSIERHAPTDDHNGKLIFHINEKEVKDAHDLKRTKEDQ